MLELLEIVKIIFGSIFVLFLPGFSLSYAIFPKKDEIDLIERLALGFGLSIATLPLLIFYLNFLFGLKINLINVTIVNLALIAAGYILYIKRNGHPHLPLLNYKEHSKYQKK